MVRFREQQSLVENPLLRALIGGAIVLPPAVAAGLALAGRAPAAGRLVLLLAPPMLGVAAVAALLGAARLTVEVRDDGVHVRFAPFQRRARRFPPDQIADVVARTYRPIRDYGGWGIRLALGGRRAYTVSGNAGCELILVDGRRIMIGSREPERLAGAVRALIAGRRAPGVRR